MVHYIIKFTKNGKRTEVKERYKYKHTADVAADIMNLIDKKANAKVIKKSG